MVLTGGGGKEEVISFIGKRYIGMFGQEEATAPPMIHFNL